MRGNEPKDKALLKGTRKEFRTSGKLESGSNKYSVMYWRRAAGLYIYQYPVARPPGLESRTRILRIEELRGRKKI